MDRTSTIHKCEKCLNTNAKSDFKSNSVRSEGRTSRSPVLQALNLIWLHLQRIPFRESSVFLYNPNSVCYSIYEVIIMKCPKCNSDMESGFLQWNSEKSLTWTPKLLPLGLGYWNSDSQAIQTSTGIGVNAIPCQICKHCSIFIGDYAEK